MNIEIKEYAEYRQAEILELYKSVGWVNYTNNLLMLENAYYNSLKILGAYSEEKLVGIIRIVGDGYSIIYIQDILVLPEYQHKGIGKALLQRALEEFSGVYQKVLLMDNTEKTIAFYKACGFSTDCDMGCMAFVKMK